MSVELPADIWFRVISYIAPEDGVALTQASSLQTSDFFCSLLKDLSVSARHGGDQGLLARAPAWCLVYP